VRFIAGFLGVGVLIWAIGFASRLSARGSDGDLVGALAIAAYLLTIQAVLNAIVYGVVMLVTARGTQGRRSAAIDVGAGAIASVMLWTGIGRILVEPLATSMAAAWIGFVLPGVVSAGLAIVAVRVVRKRQ